MYYTGIDLHKKTSFLTTVTESGGIVKRANLENVPETILDYFKGLDAPTRVVMESMCSWYWLYDLLSEHGFDVVLSNPVKTKAIASAKIKNDRLDSNMLAQLLRADLVATVHVSSKETRWLKELVRHRQRLVHDSTRMKNRIHMILMKNNIIFRKSDLFGVQGMAFLKEVTLPDEYRSQVNTYLDVYTHLKQEVERLTGMVNKMAKENPMATLLMTIPGIGPITSMFIVSEVEDIRRFPSHRNLASYAGLVPSLDASGGKSRHGGITKQGSPYLRTAFIEAAQAISGIRRPCRLNMFFRRMIVKNGYQKAIVATAHKLLQYAYYVLKNQTPYQEEFPVRT